MFIGDKKKDMGTISQALLYDDSSQLSNRYPWDCIQMLCIFFLCIQIHDRLYDFIL